MALSSNRILPRNQGDIEVLQFTTFVVAFVMQLPPAAVLPPISSQEPVSPQFLQLVQQAIACVNDHHDLPPSAPFIEVCVGRASPDGNPSPTVMRFKTTDANGDGLLDPRAIVIYEEEFCYYGKLLVENHEIPNDVTLLDALKNSKSALVAMIVHEIAHLVNPNPVLPPPPGVGATSIESNDYRNHVLGILQCVEAKATHDSLSKICAEAGFATGADRIAVCILFCSQRLKLKKILAGFHCLQPPFGNSYVLPSCEHCPTCVGP